MKTLHPLYIVQIILVHNKGIILSFCLDYATSIIVDFVFHIPILKQGMASAIEPDSSDRTFLKYLKEISQAYTILPKQLRLRSEKWVEKLTQTGSNPTWKKHRNAYAKLLLNQILGKQLSDPFQNNPPGLLTVRNSDSLVCVLFSFVFYTVL